MSKRFVFFIIFIVILEPVSIAQNMQKSTRVSRGLPPLGAWTAEQWTADEHPFLHMKTQVESAVTTSSVPTQLLQKYQEEAQRNPLDAPTQFRWGYCLMRTFTKLTEKQKYQHLYLSKVSEALGRPKSPRSYEYARLRFLILRMEKRISGLEALGERLLKRDPNDQTVKFLMVDVLSFSIKPGASERGLKYAQELVNSKPLIPNNYSVLGSAFLARWMKSKAPSDADKAIDAYKQYLRLAPSDDPWKGRAQSLINTIKEDKIRVAKELKAKPQPKKSR